MLGASAAHLTGDRFLYVENTLDVGLTTWLGYDCWVADQWSVGGLLRFAGARDIDNKNTSDVEVYTCSILTCCILVTAPVCTDERLVRDGVELLELQSALPQGYSRQPSRIPHCNKQIPMALGQFHIVASRIQKLVVNST